MTSSLTSNPSKKVTVSVIIKLFYFCLFFYLCTVPLNSPAGQVTDELDAVTRLTALFVRK